MTKLRKFIVIGDVHAEYSLMWEALQAAGCATEDCLPTEQVISGLYQVVFVGDIIHPKSEFAYKKLIGIQDEYNFKNKDHVKKAFDVQVQGLEKLYRYSQASTSSIHFILGNHDDVILNPAILLGTGTGLKHIEFDPGRGGHIIPSHLAQWFSSFVRELRVGRVQFSHVGPVPSHSYYDDMFYSDKSHRRWFLDTPEYVEMAGLELGVYGHTKMDRGILFHEEYRFALVDALEKREYLELMLNPATTRTVQGWQIGSF